MTTKLNAQEFYPWMGFKSRELTSFDQRPDSIRGKAYRLNTGAPCKSWFPEGVKFEVDSKSGPVLADSIPNVVLLKIVSARLKGVLEEQSSGEIEFLPVEVLDHQHVPVDSPYFVANALTVISCMDHEQSDFVMSALDKTQVHHIRRLVLDLTKIPEETNLFRLAEEPDLVLVRGDLAEAINDSGCTGINFTDIRDYGKQYRPIDRAALASRILEGK